MQVSEVLIGCAAGIALAIISYSIVGRLKKMLYTRQQNKQRIRIVSNVLHAALAQRAIIRLEVMQGDFKGFSAEGICNAVAPDHMILQITDAFGAHQWVDVPLILFLSVQQNKKTSYFHFTTTAFTSVRKGTFTELHLALPNAVSPGQKRAFLRYTPPKSAVMGMGLWFMSGNSALPTSRDGLGKPYLFYRPNAHNDIVLDNVSAGGLRVFIHERAMAHSSHLMEKDAHLMFLLVLANKKSKETVENTEQKTENGQEAPKSEAQEQEKNTLSIWISCRIAMRSHEEKNNLWLVSVRFENWAPLDEKSKKIMWFPTDSNKSIPPLSTWVMRSHMEETKKI